MSEEEKEFVYKIVTTMYGEIEPCGSTEIDNERYHNLRYYEFIVDSLIRNLFSAAENIDSSAYSVNRAGERAYNYLKDLNEYITDGLNLIKENCEVEEC